MGTQTTKWNAMLDPQESVSTTVELTVARRGSFRYGVASSVVLQ